MENLGNDGGVKRSIIYTKNILITQEIDRIKEKKSTKNLLNYNETIKDREEKILTNAYKNIINVITNLLDNIEDEKNNGKSNNLQVKSMNIKSPIKKLMSYDLRKKSKYSLINNSPKNEKFSKFKPPSKKNSYNSQKKMLFRKISSNNKEESGKNSSLLEDKKNPSFRKRLYKNFSKKNQNLNLFFKPKNRLKSRYNSSKFIFQDYASDKSLIKNDNFDKSKYNSSISSLNYSHSQLNSKNFSSSKDIKQKNEFESETNYYKNFDLLKNKKDINLKLNIDSNNESNFNNSTNVNKTEESNSTNVELIDTKSKKFTNTESSQNIYNNKKYFHSKRGSIDKALNKEKKYRYLFSKGYVYDSLDDEEEFGEEEIASWSFEPNSIYLYILDSIVLLSSLIIIFYLPIYLSKKLYFCTNLIDISTIIFFFIDFIYIFDFIINFFRSYYNFDEILIKNKLNIFIHYVKTWLFLDLICSIPIYTLMHSLETTCNNNISLEINNNSHNFTININKKHYIFSLIKAIKIIKEFENNLAAIKLKQFFNEFEFLCNYGDVFIYSLFFISFLNFSSCIFIFLGRNIINSWIIIDDLEEKSLIDIYIGAIYYLIMTVTTVGYGDIIGRSINEIIFQIIMLIAGTCFYSWLLSSISNYVKKINEKNSKFEEKIQILEEIKINNPHMTEKLYNKILRLINYRKYHEEETEKNIILESLPNALKNSLIIEMYKTYINGFLFFKGIENREFIVKIISKLTPIIGIKGDILIQEGEKIEEIIFIKNGVLSLEIWINMNCPEESIQKYLNENGFITKKLKYNTYLKTSSKNNKSSIISSNINNKKANSAFNNYYFEKIYNNDEKALNEINNKKKLKILEIRKNEHFGDVFMLLNKKSPLYARVISRKADLLLLKKLDAFAISDRYPDIWKIIIKKPLENSKMIANLTLKTLVTFCNLNGIKTTLFQKMNDDNSPNYYLIPSIYKRNNNTLKIQKNNTINKYMNNNLDKLKGKNHSSFNEESRKNEFNRLRKKENKEKNNYIYNKSEIINNNFENDLFSFRNKTINTKENESFEKSKFISKEKNKDKINKKQEKNSTIYKLNKNKNNKIINNKSNINKDEINNLDFISNKINNEILPGENFNIQIHDDDKSKNFFKNIYKDNIYINNLNIYGINYKEMPIIKQINNNILQKVERRIFNELKISSNSSFEIQSSYENINEITLNKYISDHNLREETKVYLEEKCKFYDKKEKTQLSPKKSFNKNIERIQIQNTYNKLKNNSYNKNLFKNNFRFSTIKKKLEIKEKNNKMRRHTNLLFKKQQYELIKNIKNNEKKSYNGKTNNEIRRNNSSNSFNNVNNLINIENPEKSFSQMGSDILNKSENNKINNKKNHHKQKLKENIKHNISPNKRKKKLKEIDIISSNILNSSQNLNQPDIFYAGLFNQLLSKNNYKFKDSNN